MRLDVGPTGVTIDAHDLGPLLGCAPEAVPQLMRDGKITSFFEKGADEDAGRFRVTFRMGNTRVRLTCSEDGRVLSRMRVKGAEHGDKLG